MANKSIFGSSTVRVPETNTINEAGGVAYKQTDKAALAQCVLTGTFNNTFYATGGQQVDTVAKLCGKVPAKFIAQLAVYSREHGYMKDTPAYLVAQLAVRDLALFKQVFHTVIDNGKMLRNFCQIIRSGAVGRKSFGSALKKEIQKWLANRSDVQLFRDIVGNDPSLSDVIKMVRPRPTATSREVMYAYITGHLSFAVNSKGVLAVTKTVPVGNGNTKTEKIALKNVPTIVQEYELYKLTKKGIVPNVPFQMLTALELGNKEWTEIARNAQWMMTRMNLNTFARHGVFNDSKMVDMIANRLSDKEQIVNAKAFPYQLFTAYQNTSDVPHKISEALQDAMEIAIENVPEIDGKVYVCVDTSGSMSSPITGYRPGSTTATSCVQVAGLIAAAILRKNPTAEVIPFDTHVHDIRLNSRDSVMTNAKKLARNGGGTSCGAPIKYLNDNMKKGDLVIMVSDNESWVQSSGYRSPYNSGTDMAMEWSKFKKRNNNAKLVCLDLTPNTSVQVVNSSDVMNIGGFSDICFDLFSSFVKGDLSQEAMVSVVESVSLDSSNVRKSFTEEKRPIKVRKSH